MAKEKWFIRTKGADFQAWARELGVDPVVARVIRNRDNKTLEEARAFLRGEVSDCHSPWEMKDMDQAVSGLMDSLQREERIRVIGDYDVDGICSTFILTKGIRKLRGRVDYAIPHRIHDGYGLNEQLIQAAHEEGVNLIVTCDNGIAAREPIERANELGMRVIVTDHHEVPFVAEGDARREALPPALAVVDPKREGETYPFSGICGAVVAFKLMQAVLDKLEKGSGNAMLPSSGHGLEAHAGELREFLEEAVEFAALATVCDVMELKDENRILVREGLRRMRDSRNQGLRALINVCGIARDTLSAYHFGFILGPCLNATGRLDTAQKAMELLFSGEYEHAIGIARELKDLNDSRKNMTAQGVSLAEQAIREKGLDKDKVLVLYLPEVHESLAGLIAGRIKEQYGRPVFVMTKGEEGVKGSGRSIEQYHMYEALTEVSELLTKFGGHKMAAGFSLEEENVESFRRELNAKCTLREEDFIPNVYIDMEMPIAYPDAALARQLEALEPYGFGNPKPLFVQRDLLFLSGKRLGKEGRFGRFEVRTPDGARRSLVYFGDVNAFLADWEAKFGRGSGARLLEGREAHSLHVVYQIALNEYRGETELQLQMKHYQ